MTFFLALFPVSDDIINSKIVKNAPFNFFHVILALSNEKAKDEVRFAVNSSCFCC